MRDKLSGVWGPIAGFVIALVLLYLYAGRGENDIKSRNYWTMEKAKESFNRLARDSILSTDDTAELQLLLGKIERADLEHSWKNMEAFYSILTEHLKYADFVVYHTARTNKGKWFEQNWPMLSLVAALPVVILSLIGLVFRKLNSIPKTVGDAISRELPRVSTTAADAAVHSCPAYSDKPKLDLSVDALLPSELAERVSSPVGALIDRDTTRVLKDFLAKAKKEDSSIHTGMIWTIPDVDVKKYGTLAQALDEAVVSAEGGTIYSTNLIPPNDFSEEAVKKHVEKVNQLQTDNAARPRALRLQIVRRSGTEGTLGLLEKDIFLENLRSNAWPEYVDYYLKENSIFLVDSKAEIAKTKNILGDYILYDNKLVLRWDDKVSSLYLMFGTEVVEVYGRIFVEFLEHYDKYKGLVNQASPIMDLYAWAQENGLV